MQLSFLSYIQQEKLFSLSDKILVTVSGGVDSIVLCELFHQTKLKFSIAHCNFQLRDNESNADEKFVEQLASKYNVPFYSVRFNTKDFVEENKISTQMAARELRYNWFEEIRKNENYNYIATAHHLDDSIETFFINLIRGTGIAGLHGILSKQGNIIRPLLFATKNQILDFASKEKLKFREDSSNSSDKYMRNKIRHHIIPLLKELNPSFETSMNDTIQRLIKVEEIYNWNVKLEKRSLLHHKDNYVTVEKWKLKATKHSETYLYECLKTFNFNESTVKEIILGLSSEPGKQFFSPTHRLIIDREVLIIEEKSQITARLPTEYATIDENKKIIFIGAIEVEFKTKLPSDKITRTRTTANLDFDKLSFPLEIRKWQQGDSFYPLGMKNKKKLSDFFIDNKLSLNQKENTWLLTSAGEIAWIIGMRIDNRFKVTDKTKKIYFAELIK